MKPADLGPNEVEVLAQVDVLIGTPAGVEAALGMLQYKVGKLLRMAGGDPDQIVQLNMELNAQVVAKKTTAAPQLDAHELPAIAAPVVCTVCGEKAIDVADTPVPGYEGDFVQHEPRCEEHK